MLSRVATAVDTPLGRVKQALVTCGDPGSVRGRCWNGSPYQPVPVALDVHQSVALRILEQPEDYPAVVAQQQSLRAYPSPYGVNLADIVGYLSPITAGELAHARKHDDTSVNAASTVGRAGVEQEYDRYLRGRPGYQRVAVDSMGRVLGDDGKVPGRPGDTLVTSIDAKVQATTERALAEAIRTARATYDPVTHRNYLADSGAAIVLQARHRSRRRDGQPADVRPLGLGRRHHQQQLNRLYSKKAGDPLLARALQGQFAPGSTWKPFMTVGALNNGFSPSTRLDCSSGFQVGNRLFHNYESESLGTIDFAKALQVSCDTFFYRVGYHFWQKFGSDPTNVDARDPLVNEAKAFGFGRPTGIDVPGESAGRIADRQWKLAYWKSMKGYYCGIDQHPPTGTSGFLKLFAHEFCLEGSYYRAGDAVNFAIGQGDTLVTPLQLARAYAALSNGGTLYEPRIAKAIVEPQRPAGPADRAEGAGPREGPRARDRLRQPGAAGHRQGRHHGLEDGRLPARPGAHPVQDRVGRGLRQAVDVVGRVLRQELRRGDDGQPGRHRLGHLRPVRPQDLGVAVRRRTARTWTRATR